MNPNVIEGLVSDLSNLKTGWKTSEFWVALAPIVVAALSVFGVGVSNDATVHFVTIAAGAVSAVYVGGRTVLKTAHIGHKANLAALLHSVETEGLAVVKEVEPTVVKAIASQPSPIPPTPSNPTPVA